MARVHIPAALRALTGGCTSVSAPGGTLGAVIDALEAAHPGVKARLTDGERIRAGFAIFIGGVQAPPRLAQRIDDNAEIYFAPAISGG